jgi:hypothetical protein
MDTSRLKIFDKSNIDTLPWPNTERGNFAKHFLLPMILQGPSNYIDNVKTSMQVALFDNQILPITINEQEETQNSYVCSAYSHYIEYGKKELNHVKNKFFRFLFLKSLKSLGKILKVGKIDKTVYVNNWLLSTNFYPPLEQEQIRTLTSILVERFPEHAIAFRSINRLRPSGLCDSFERERFDLVISRMIYFTDTTSQEPFQSRMFKSDMQLCKKSPYTICKTQSLSETGISRICELYKKLNIEKHNPYNPQFNKNFVHLILNNPSFTLQTLEQKGNIDAALAYFDLDKEMTSPFFAYDTSISQKAGLYRQISTLLLLKAKEKGAWLHQSGGGGSSKSLRRACPSLEYTAVYNRHLPLNRQMPWKALAWFMTPLIRSFLNVYNP